MGVQEFDNEEDFDAAGERIEELNFQHMNLKEEVRDRERALECAEEELRNFEDDNKEFLL